VVANLLCVTMVCLIAELYENQGARHGVEVAIAPVTEDQTALAIVVELAATGKVKPCIEHIVPLAD
jgi:hypothetical protein